ncbi:hypothetical protein CEXT_587131 [Caerostris extrusa]|uniref:Uncharacterized protein n=1 Tax=Caerostris extrusa TaxID=172846 RepID=A0AAV4RSG4_CAEEX|nr:hypothetical protein CEXT_587131 [Caerostris extrusa]
MVSSFPSISGYEENRYCTLSIDTDLDSDGIQLSEPSRDRGDTNSIPSLPISLRNRMERDKMDYMKKLSKKGKEK